MEENKEQILEQPKKEEVKEQPKEEVKEEQPKEKKLTKAQEKELRIKELKKDQEELASESFIMDMPMLKSTSYDEMDFKLITLLAGKTKHHGLVIEGTAGVGKTTRVMTTFTNYCKKHGINPKKDIAVMEGFTTPAQFFVWAYENRKKKYKILDDVVGVLDNIKTLSILKALLWGENGKRIAEYNTTKPLLDSQGIEVPYNFVETGDYIIITNDMSKVSNKLQEHLNAVMSRTLRKVNIKIDRDELLNLIFQLSRLNILGASQEDKDEVFKYIKDNSGIYSTNLDLRTYIEFVSYKLTSNELENEDWKKYAKIMLDESDIEKLLVSLHKDYDLPDNKIKEMIMKRTNCSEAKYYRLKKQLGLTKRGIKSLINKAEKEEEIKAEEVKAEVEV